MSLDLFFVPRKPEFATLRAPDFKPTPYLLRARTKLIGEITEHWPGTTLHGSTVDGRIAGFPRGELSLAPGYVAWSLHGVEDAAPIHDIVNWFFERGYVCEDPQDSGFANRELKRGQARTTLESFDELVGAQFVGVRLLREWVRGLATDWILADGSTALVQFVTFRACAVPDLGRLLDERVLAVDYESRQFDRMVVYFSGDLELTLEGAIFQKSNVVRVAPKA
jgi:hypothetical protein